MFLALGLLPAAARAEMMIRVAGARVDLTATATPLNEILDRLARQIGMKVVYEGPAPRQPVTISQQGRSPAEAVLGLLEGLGLNYALVGDTTGTKVQTLILAGAGSAPSGTSRPSGSATTATAARRPFAPPPFAAPDFMESPTEDTNDEEPEDASVMAGPPGVQTPEAVNTPGAPAAAGPASGGAGSVAPQQAYPTSPIVPQPLVNPAVMSQPAQAAAPGTPASAGTSTSPQDEAPGAPPPR
jgi:hypothetical protein